MTAKEAKLVDTLGPGRRLLALWHDGAWLAHHGLKVGNNLNLHVTNLDVTHRLALPRRGK